MKDFSTPDKKDITFKIDDDVFYAVPEAPGALVSDLADMASDAVPDLEKVKVIASFMDEVLRPESAMLFAERLRGYRLEEQEGEEEPVKIQVKVIGFQQSLDIFTWLIETYMEDIGTPTKPRSSSPNGRGRTGRSGSAAARGKATGPRTVPLPA